MDEKIAVKGGAMTRLQSCVAVVTGASRGVGRGIALALGDAGATVYVTGRTARGGDSRWPGSVTGTAEEVTKRGGCGIVALCDSARDSDLQSLMSRVACDSGGPDLLINNAYSFPPEFDDTPRGTSFWQLPLAVWDHAFDIGLRSHYVASSLAIPHMLARGRGLIINISSSAGSG